jgi:assimilatory nitrate reductase catalytic subunit
VARFWTAPRLAEKPGLKAVDMFRAVEDGRIKAIWIMATNPVDSLPEAGRFEAALARCPLVVVSDISATTDTVRHAHIALPATGWGEKLGTVTNSERRISLQRRALPAPGEARDDWWIICQFARQLGFSDDFAFAHPAQIFAEHAALSGLDNAGNRDFDISAHAGISTDEYEALEPFTWPAPAGSAPTNPRFFAKGGFFTPDRRARLVPIVPAEPAPVVGVRLNTGRARDHWHTMTRS